MSRYKDTNRAARTNIMNTFMAYLTIALLYLAGGVPIETSLQVGFLILIAYTLRDISYHQCES